MINTTEKISNTGITLFTEGDDLYEAMLTSIAQARSVIRFSSFIFCSDDIGWRFARALAERCKQGVRVYLQVDAYGSLFRFSHLMRRFLKKNGVKVHIFHRWFWRQPFRYNYRDHRKVLVIDDQIVYVGGFNIDARNSKILSGEERWHDTHLSLEGPLVEEAAAIFDHVWKPRANPAPQEKFSRATHFVSKHNYQSRFAIRSLFASALSQSRRSIFLTTPYFVPDRKTQEELIKAAERGVDVRVLLPYKIDVKICRWAARASYAKLLHAGVKIYEYQPRMLHSKTMVIDGTWVTIGSANIHTRSFIFNYELNVVSEEPGLCHHIEQHFMNNLLASTEILYSTWPDRPWSERITEVIGWLARRIL